MKVEDSSTSVRISSGESLGSSVPRPDAEHEEQRPHEQVDEPSHGIEEPGHRLQHVDEQQRGALRVGRADDLGRDLRQHDDQERDHERANRVGELVVAEEPHRHEAGQRARRGHHHRVADQNAAEQAVGALQQIRDHERADVAARHEVLQPVAVEGHHRRLGDGEEERQDEQHGERREHPRERDALHQARCSRTSRTKRLPG
jgi:hypothetical protein